MVEKTLWIIVEGITHPVSYAAFMPMPAMVKNVGVMFYEDDAAASSQISGCLKLALRCKRYPIKSLIES